MCIYVCHLIYSFQIEHHLWEQFFPHKICIALKTCWRFKIWCAKLLLLGPLQCVTWNANFKIAQHQGHWTAFLMEPRYFLLCSIANPCFKLNALGLDLNSPIGLVQLVFPSNYLVFILVKSAFNPFSDEQFACSFRDSKIFSEWCKHERKFAAAKLSTFLLPYRIPILRMDSTLVSEHILYIQKSQILSLTSLSRMGKHLKPWENLPISVERFSPADWLGKCQVVAQLYWKKSARLRS